MGSVSLLWASRSGGVCVLARVVRAPTGSSSGVLPRTVETAREGARSGLGMQLHFSGCKKSLLRAPRVPTCPAAGPPGEKVQVRASATRKSHYPSRWGREKLREPPGRPALPTAGPHPPESWGVVGRRGPRSEHYHSLHSQQEQKQGGRLIGSQLFHNRLKSGGGRKGPIAFRGPESLASLLRVHCITFETIDISCGVGRKSSSWSPVFKILPFLFPPPP